jgi:lipid A 3-O-deacylase
MKKFFYIFMAFVFLSVCLYAFGDASGRSLFLGDKDDTIVALYLRASSVPYSLQRPLAYEQILAYLSPGCDCAACQAKRIDSNGIGPVRSFLLDMPSEEFPVSPHRQPFGVFAAAGRSSRTVDVVQFGLRYEWAPISIGQKHRTLQPAVEVLFANWDSDPGHTGVTSLKELGVAGTLRYSPARHSNRLLAPFVELGFGVHYLTETEIEREELGQHMQFGSKIGLGVTLGANMDIGARIRHLSNAGLSDPNWGINHVLLVVSTRF